MIIQELIDHIESFAPLSLQAGFDNSGLICGDTNQQIRSVLICLDVTEGVLQEAICKGDNLIISHHPLIFNGLKQITPSTATERCIIAAIKNNIVIYAAHTNMDVVANGVSGRMADKLNLVDRKVLQPEGTPEDNYGYGIIGELKEPADSLSFLQQLKTTFCCKALRYTLPHKKNIQKIALCGGAGVSFLHRAIKEKADIYISGDFKYHDFFLSENRIIIADIGHYESEQFTKEIFYELVTKKSSKFAVRFSETNTNPINYL